MAVAIQMKYIMGFLGATCCLYLFKIAIIDRQYIQSSGFDHLNLHQEARRLGRINLTSHSQRSVQREKVDRGGYVDKTNDGHKAETGNQRLDDEKKYIAGISSPFNKTLLQEIRDKMVPQRAPNLVLNPQQAKGLHKSQVSQSKFIDEATGGLRNGFFVECGAADGIGISNSYFFERARNWTGLLVEANTHYFRQIQKNNRSAYSINACMSVTREASTVMFRNAGVLGGIADAMDKGHMKRIRPGTFRDSPMKCYSLHTMLQAIGQMHVNYLSLDVEGPELDILKTIPFDEVVIDFLTVEYYTTNPEQSVKKLHEIRDLLVGTGLFEQIAIFGINPTRIFVGDSMAKNEVGGLDVCFKRKSFSRIK